MLPQSVEPTMGSPFSEVNQTQMIFVGAPGSLLLMTRGIDVSEDTKDIRGIKDAKGTKDAKDIRGIKDTKVTKAIKEILATKVTKALMGLMLLLVIKAIKVIKGPPVVQLVLIIYGALRLQKLGPHVYPLT